MTYVEDNDDDDDGDDDDDDDDYDRDDRDDDDDRDDENDAEDDNVADDDVEDDDIEDDEVQDDDVEEEDDDVEDGDVEDDEKKRNVADYTADDDDVEDDMEEEEEDRSQDRDLRAVWVCAVFVRACTFEMHMDMHVTRTMLCKNLQQKCRAPDRRCTFCASLCSRNAHGHLAMRHFLGKTSRPRNAQSQCTWACDKSHFMRKLNLQGKRCVPGTPRTFCASRRSQNSQGHLTRAMLFGNLQGKRRAARFARACAVEMHMDMWQELFYAKIYRAKAGARVSTSINHRP